MYLLFCSKIKKQRKIKMANLISISFPPLYLTHTHTASPAILKNKHQRHATSSIVSFAAKSGGGFSLNSILNPCKTCRGQGAIECPGCKGTGKNKKNGNIFERWKCYDCQGFGLKSCPNCGQGGLTPEQRGER